MFSIICPTANLLNNTDPGVQTTHLSKTFYVFKFRLFYKNPRREEFPAGTVCDAAVCGQSLVAFSSFFMMEKMKTAEMTQRAMRIDHSTQRGRPPQSMPMMETM